MTTILALDTSTDFCSIALWQDGILCDRHEHKPRQHTRELLPMVDDILKRAQMTLRDIDAIAFGAGPGSFTGLRICLGFAQGLAYSVDVPLIPVSTLKAMALRAIKEHGAGDITVIQDARMNELYVGRYQGSTASDLVAIEADALSKPEDFSVDSHALILGTGFNLLDETARDSLNSGYRGEIEPRAIEIAELALLDFKQNNVVPAHLAEPVYLRNEVSWKKRVKKSDAQ